MGFDYYKTFLRVYIIKVHEDKNSAHEQQKTFLTLLPILTSLDFT